MEESEEKRDSAFSDFILAPDSQGAPVVEAIARSIYNNTLPYEFVPETQLSECTPNESQQNGGESGCVSGVLSELVWSQQTLTLGSSHSTGPSAGSTNSSLLSHSSIGEDSVILIKAKNREDHILGNPIKFQRAFEASPFKIAIL